MVLVPVGFVSDHMEVVHDLDTEAMETAKELGLVARRAATVGTSAPFVRGLVDLLEERAALARGAHPRAAHRRCARPLAIGLPGRLLPQPARRTAGGVRRRLDGAAGRVGRPMSERPGPDLLAELVALAERVARQAGDLVRDGRPDRVDVAATKSSPTDVVTAMDTASEALLRREIQQARPDDGILGEEGGLEAGPSGLTWVVDPIDGTVNYLYGIPAYAISVAVVSGDPLDPGGAPGARRLRAPPVVGGDLDRDVAAAGPGSPAPGSR